MRIRNVILGFLITDKVRKQSTPLGRNLKFYNLQACRLFLLHFLRVLTWVLNGLVYSCNCVIFTLILYLKRTF